MAENKQSVKDLVESWDNGWLVSFSEPYKDENSMTWIDAKFSKPTQTEPIPKHFVLVRFKLIDGEAASYLIESDHYEKTVDIPITDATLKMFLRVKAKGGARVHDLGLL